MTSYTRWDVFQERWCSNNEQPRRQVSNKAKDQLDYWKKTSRRKQQKEKEIVYVCMLQTEDR